MIKELVLKRSYISWGEDLEISCYDSTLSDSSTIVFKVTDVEDTKVYYTWNVLGGPYVVNTSLSITNSLFNKPGLYKVAAFNNGVFIASDIFSISYSGVLIRHGLETLLEGFQTIPVYDEIGVVKGESGNYCVYFTYKPWVIDERLIVRENGDDLTLYSDVIPDPRRGMLLLKKYTVGNDYSCTYKFRFFDEEEWNSYLKLSLDELNSTNPATSYTLENMPKHFDAAVVMGAYRKCLIKLLLDIEFWNSRLIFPEPSGLRSTLQALLTNATTDFAELKKEVKRRGLVKPVGISTFKMTVPRHIDNINYRMYTIASIGVPPSY